jgi:hypothetical protein
MHHAAWCHTLHGVCHHCVYIIALGGGERSPSRSGLIHTHTRYTIRIHTYMHACIHTWTHTYMHTHTCIHIYMHAYTHTYIPYIRTYVHACIHAHTDTQTQRETHTQTLSHTHAHAIDDTTNLSSLYKMQAGSRWTHGRLPALRCGLCRPREFCKYFFVVYLTTLPVA